MAKDKAYVAAAAVGTAEETPDRDAEATPPVETVPEATPEGTPEPVTAEPAAAEADLDNKVTLHVILGETKEEELPKLLYKGTAATKMFEQLGNMERFAGSMQKGINAVIRQEAQDQKGMEHGVQRWFLQTFSLFMLLEEKAIEGQAILQGQALCSPDGEVINR
jgi:hypothetical protein